jgi:hypothetical protein
VILNTRLSERPGNPNGNFSTLLSGLSTASFLFFFFFSLPDLSPTGKRHSREGNRGGQQNGGTNIEAGCKKINGKGKIQARGNPERLCFSFRVYENSSREKLIPWNEVRSLTVRKRLAVEARELEVTKDEAEEEERKKREKKNEQQVGRKGRLIIIIIRM